MEVLFAKCAGLDVHLDTVVACARIAGTGRASTEVQTFGTKTSDLLALSEWLSEREVTHVAMEATGVYWKPVWHILEGDFELVLANAMHVKNVPGRKTDVNDATWIANLLAHGLIRSSFVPPAPVQELRALTRTRKQLMRERTSHVQRIDKILQDANLKLGSVLTDIMGQSGRGILAALIDGETDPEQLVAHVNKRVKAPRAEIVEALRGKVTAMLAAFAEFARDLLRERVRGGLERARRDGTRLGRPPTAALHAKEIRALRRQDLSHAAIARQLGIGESSVLRILTKQRPARRS